MIIVFTIAWLVSLTMVETPLVTNPWIRWGVLGLLVCGVLFLVSFLPRWWSNSGTAAPASASIRSILDPLNDGVLLLDEQGHVRFANQTFQTLTDLPEGNLLGRSISDLPWSTPKQAGQTDVGATLAAVQAGTLNTPVSLLFGCEIAHTFSIRSAPWLNNAGKRQGVIVTVQDVSVATRTRAELSMLMDTVRQSADQIRRQNTELERLLTRDQLTGCLNRRSFLEHLEKYWAESTQQRSPLACILLDIDDFHLINEQYGNEQGDDVLQRLGRALQRSAQQPDLVCRYGGEEFVVLLPRTSLDDAARIADQCRQAAQRLDIPDLRITVSAGVSAISEFPRTPQGLLDQASQALMFARAQGRNRTARFDESHRDLQFPLMISGSERPAEASTILPYPAVTALISALAFRDVETAAHSRRVADLCVSVGQRLMSMSNCYVLETAALLHDIGKIGIPDAVLHKPAPLTEEEWNVMRSHDTIGAELIRASFGSPELSEIVERYRTSYEASRARGESLPLGARILAVADAYDAMVTNRLFRAGLSHAEAVAELTRGAGTQFDPEIVTHFLEILAARGSETTLKLEVARETALALGMELERLADAADQQNLVSLKMLAGRLAATAYKNGVPEIAAKALELESAAMIGTDLLGIMRCASELLSYCRATQATYFTDRRSTVLNS